MMKQSSVPCSSSRPQAQRHVQRLLVPPACVRMVLEVHSDPSTPTWCLSVEASDPHTRELLAMTLDPSVRNDGAVLLAQRVMAEVRVMLLELLDPELEE